MRRLIFATNNRHKVEEVRAALKGKVEVVSLAEAGLEGEIPETADTLQGNALQKAQWVWERTHTDCFADDTGLEVDALGGAPGVYSARYAAMSGERDLCGANAAHSCSFDDNINKLLAALQGETNRKADFRTVICLIESKSQQVKESKSQMANEISFFEGRVDGQILTERHGAEGFGYDPVFMPDRFAVSFAEMPLEVKNSISHRGLAVAKLLEYLSK